MPARSLRVQRAKDDRAAYYAVTAPQGFKQSILCHGRDHARERVHDGVFDLAQHDPFATRCLAKTWQDHRQPEDLARAQELGQDHPGTCLGAQEARQRARSGSPAALRTEHLEGLHSEGRTMDLELGEGETVALTPQLAEAFETARNELEKGQLDHWEPASQEQGQAKE